jgi:hypothetical protein
MQHRGVPRVTITFENEDLELVERSCRALAERARRDAEGCKGNFVERLHRSAQAQWLRLADRIKAARLTRGPGAAALECALDQRPLNADGRGASNKSNQS